MSTPPPEIPLQTITTTSDQLGKELAERLGKALAGFYISVGDGHQLFISCDRQYVPEWIEVPSRAVIDLVRLALAHECAAAR